MTRMMETGAGRSPTRQNQPNGHRVPTALDQILAFVPGEWSGFGTTAGRSSGTFTINPHCLQRIIFPLQLEGIDKITRQRRLGQMTLNMFKNPYIPFLLRRHYLPLASSVMIRPDHKPLHDCEHPDHFAYFLHEVAQFHLLRGIGNVGIGGAVI